MTGIELDTDDQQDSDRTEATVAQALAAEFLRSGATVAGAAEIFGYARRIRDAVGNALHQYALRVLSGFTSKAGRDSAEFVDEIADSAVESAVQTAAGATDEILTAAREDNYARLRGNLDTLSRILVTQVREQAKHDAATRMGAVGRVWRTRKDQRVRVSHYDLEGEFKKVGIPFVTINDAELQFPGDPTAPLNERLGCRCRLSWRVPA